MNTAIREPLPSSTRLVALAFPALAAFSALAAVVQLLAVADRFIQAGVMVSKFGFGGALISAGTTMLAAFFALTGISLLCSIVAWLQLRHRSPRWASVARISTFSLLIVGFTWAALVLSSFVQLDSR